MTSEQFSKLIKLHAAVHGIKGPDLEAAVGHILTESVRAGALEKDDPIEGIRDYLFVIATILKCWGITVDIFEHPQTLKALRLMTEILERTSPIEDEFIQ